MAWDYGEFAPVASGALSALAVTALAALVGFLQRPRLPAASKATRKLLTGLPALVVELACVALLWGLVPSAPPDRQPLLAAIATFGSGVALTKLALSIVHYAETCRERENPSISVRSLLKSALWAFRATYAGSALLLAVAVSSGSQQLNETWVVRAVAVVLLSAFGTRQVQRVLQRRRNESPLIRRTYDMLRSQLALPLQAASLGIAGAALLFAHLAVRTPTVGESATFASVLVGAFACIVSLLELNVSSSTLDETAGWTLTVRLGRRKAPLS